MKVHTRREAERRRWEESVARYRGYLAKSEIIPINHRGYFERCAALDFDHSTTEERRAIFRFCYELHCDECQSDADVTVEVGEEPNYESATVHLCPDCLRKAVALLPDEPTKG